MHNQWHWGVTATWRTSQGGLTLSCDGHWRPTKSKTMMTRPRLQYLEHDAPPSPPPPSPPPRTLRDADGEWRCHSLRASLNSYESLLFMLILHQQLGSLLYSSKLSAGLLSSLLPPFKFHSNDRHIFLQISYPVLLFSL